MRHLDVDLLTLVLEGHLPPGTLLRVILGHLEDLCPECHEAFEILRQESGVVPPERAAEVRQLRDHLRGLGGGHDAEGGEYEGAFASAAGGVEELARRERAERHAARRDVAALCRLPADQQAARILDARTRFRSPAVADGLLAECRRRIHDDPEEARRLAELVPVVLSVLRPPVPRRRVEALRLRALAWEANALRVVGRLAEADAAFARVRAGLAREALDDAALHADVCSLEASLRTDQARYAEARRLLDRAVLLFRQEGDRRELGRVLIQLGIVERRKGEAARAIDRLREVLALLVPEEEPSLYLSAVGNLALVLCDAQRFTEAAELIAAKEPLFAAQQGLRWRARQGVLRGRIAHGTGRLDEAERLFVEVREGAMARRDFFSAALASLELATLYLEQGRMREVREVAAVVGAVFEAHDLRSETAAALLLFTRAARTDRLTAEMVRRLRWKLEVGGRAAAAPPPAS
jgi:tetratricopeptide (TPR) repeat protein